MIWRPRPAPRAAAPRRSLAARRSLALGAAVLAGLPAYAQTAADLTALSLEQLLDVVIVGASKYEQKQSEVAAAASVITRQEIRAFGWRTLDDALASLPGAYTTYDRQYSYLGLRGFGLPGDYNTRVLVMINGNRVNDLVYDQAHLGRDFPLDLDLVERIEFVPGPGGAVYGQNAMFGVVNVVTRDGADLAGVEAGAAAQRPQRLQEGRVSWGRRFDNGVDLLVSASTMRARGEDLYLDFGAAGVSGVAAGLDGERDDEFYARVAQGAWSAELVHGDRHKDDPTAAFLADPLVRGVYQADRQTLLQATYQDSVAAGSVQWSARLFAGWKHYVGQQSYGNLFRFPAEATWRGGEVRLLSTAWDGHKWMLGLEGQDNVRADQGVQDLANPQDDLVIRSPGYRIGVYVQDEWRIADTLVATLGVRVDRNDRIGNSTSPRAALIWQAAPQTTLKALAGRAFRAPNAYERDYGDAVTQVANPALDGERIETVELIADHRLDHGLALRASGYAWSMRKLVTLGTDPVSGLPQYQSGGSVRAHGLELSADKVWSAGTRLRASTSLQDASYAAGGAPLNSPSVLGRVNFSGPLPWAGLRAGYEWRYDGRRLTLDGSKLGAYAVSNLHLVTDALGPGVELSLGLRNLFDKRYAHPGSDSNWQNALEQDGRSVRLGLALRY